MTPSMPEPPAELQLRRFAEALEKEQFEVTVEPALAEVGDVVQREHAPSTSVSG